jgi:hypothetical protein
MLALLLLGQPQHHHGGQTGKTLKGTIKLTTTAIGLIKKLSEQ